MRRCPNGHQDSKSREFPVLTLPPTICTALIAGPVAGPAAATVAQVAQTIMLAGSVAIRTLPRPRDRHGLLGTIQVVARIELNFDANVGYRIVRRRRRRSLSLLVIPIPLHIIADDLVGFRKLLIFRLGYLVAWIPVGVNGDGLLPEGSADLVGARRLLHAEYCVVIRFNGHPNILSCTRGDRKKIGS